MKIQKYIKALTATLLIGAMALTAGCGGEDTAASGSGSDTNADGRRVITVAHTNYYVPHDFVNDQGGTASKSP